MEDSDAESDGERWRNMEPGQGNAATGQGNLATGQGNPATGHMNSIAEQSNQNNQVRNNVATISDGQISNHTGTNSFENSHNHSLYPLNIHVDRPVYTQPEFDHECQVHQRKPKTLREWISDQCSPSRCTSNCCKHFIFNLFPFIGIMSNYKIQRDFPDDLIAGLTVGIMQIPQGMAYGLLASMPPIVGLYVSFFPGIFYFFLGTSRHINIGTFAVISLMVGSVVDKFECGSTSSTPEGNTSLSGENMTITLPPSAENIDALFTEETLCKIGVATAVCLSTGIIQVLMGVLQLGFISIYLSEPLTRGFTTGAAVHVFSSQIKYIFGIKVLRFTGIFKLIRFYIDFFGQITKTNPAPVIISVVCLVLLYVTKEYINPRVKKKIRVPIPIELLVVVGSTLASYYMQLDVKYDVKVVGNIPTGIPPPRIPPLSRMPNVFPDSVSIAIVSFAISVSMAKLFSKKHDYPIRPNQELVAYGLTNGISSFFMCFVSCVSLSRSVVHESLGGSTQIVSLISCGLVAIVLFFIGALFEKLPNACLAAIILVALKGVFLQFKDLSRLWRVDKFDFLIWLVAFTGTVLLDVDIGLIVAVGFSLLTVIFRTQRPHCALMGRVPHTDIYKDVQVYKTSKLIPGIKIFRFESSLYYANQEHFVAKLYSKTGVNPRKIRLQMLKAEKKTKKAEAKVRKRQLKHGEETSSSDVQIEVVSTHDFLPDVHSVILDCTTMGYLDSVGVNTISQVIQDYKLININVFLAGCKASIRDMLQAAGFYDKFEKDLLYLTVHDAVLASLKNNPELLSKLRKDFFIGEDTYDSVSLIDMFTIKDSHTNNLQDVSCSFDMGSQDTVDTYL